MNFKLSYERKAETMINSCLRIYFLNFLYPIVGESDVGESDDGDIEMMVTLWWWLIWDVGGRIIMLATFFVMLVIFSMY